MKPKLIIIGRWIAVLPVFAIVYVLVYLIMSFSYRFWADEDSWAIKYFLPIIGSLVSGMYSVIYGAKMAPNYKKHVAFILMVLMILFTGVLLFPVIKAERYLNLIAIIASMIGNIIGYFMCSDGESLENL